MGGNTGIMKDVVNLEASYIPGESEKLCNCFEKALFFVALKL